jgi:hypothetical protein
MASALLGWSQHGAELDVRSDHPCDWPWADRGAQEDLDANTWFTLDLGVLVRALMVFTTHQSRFKTAASIPIEQFKDGWAHATDGIRFAANFLRSNAGIEDESLLSSTLFVIALGY